MSNTAYKRTGWPRLRAFAVAVMSLFFDVRITRKGKVYIELNDRKARIQKARELRAQRNKA